ncbi:ATP-dependent helicase HrpB [Nitrincola alkalisediminis]|uniref:ATP-dependent helicase HrpB n=1 Tax=Nitrincola alkalisediminis TaxID=1366656 RepID=UPI00187672C3|nr:ATP-dependent helicase HrpB [Nitrincola alkalisediminis]
MHTTALPIDDVIPKLCESLQTPGVVLLSAEPGAGKTTRVPLALLDAPWLVGKRIVMLEPRRVAARNAALFMAQQCGESVGETVGYRIRLDAKISQKTRIEVVTEGILTRLLQDDPELTGVGLVIFDEFHERNLQSDLALALVHHSQQILRPDLRILIMSATLDVQTLTSALDAPLIQSKGRSFPVSVHYQPPLNTQISLIDHCAQVVRQALTHEGDILVFLPGVREINQLQNALSNLANDIQVLPLHAQLSNKAQEIALKPAATGQRKIILATNIAESSITLDGVRVVIDSGLERRSVFHVSSGLNELKTRRISRASAEQRCGRAGRQAAGVCYRLWPESTHERLDAHIRADILEADLAPLLIELLRWGAEPSELFWLTPPPLAALQQARDLLQQLGLITQDQLRLTEQGLACARLGIEPRWAHALICAQSLGLGKLACDIVALIQEWPNSLRKSDDLIRLIGQARQHNLWQQRVDPLSRRLWQQLQSQAISVYQEHFVSEDALPAVLVALAFPDRIARRRDHNLHFLLSNGRGAELLPQSDLVSADWLACADFSINQTTRIRLACEVSGNHLELLQSLAPQMFNQRTQIGWQENGQHLARRSLYLGELHISSEALPDLSAEDWQQAWKDIIHQRGINCLRWSEAAVNLRARLSLLHEYEGGDWPDVSDTALLGSMSTWLLPFLNHARHLRDLDKVDTYSALLCLLSWEQQQQLSELLPLQIKVPSGSNVTIDYAHKPPILAVKLQEMFGYEGQPTVLNGRLPLLIHLLSPARRPLQITGDLPHFWRHAYTEVRKEMRGRYPKHPWPENPLSAEATRLTKAAIARK